MNQSGYYYKYPHPAIATDCVVFALHDGRLHVLLIERRFDPCQGCWAFPGGYMEIDESAEAGVLRELQEETGMTDIAIHQFHTFSQPRRDPRERVVSVAFLSLVRMRQVCGADDAAQARWFSLDELIPSDDGRQAAPTLAFDHNEILACACQSLSDLLQLHRSDFSSQQEQFTEQELSLVEGELQRFLGYYHQKQQ